MIAFAEWCRPPESATLAKVLAAIEKAYGLGATVDAAVSKHGEIWRIDCAWCGGVFWRDQQITKCPRCGGT